MSHGPAAAYGLNVPRKAKTVAGSPTKSVTFAPGTKAPAAPGGAKQVRFAPGTKPGSPMPKS